MLNWARCQYTLSCKVDLVQHHDPPWCDGWSRERGVGVLGPVLARCGCPFEIRGKQHVWMVDPPDKTVRLPLEGREGEWLEIKNGTVHRAREGSEETDGTTSVETDR